VITRQISIGESGRSSK